MTFSKKLGECLCERCDHFWKPKPIGGKYIEPISCAKCKSKVWNKPRKYNLGTPQSALIVTKRDAPTGRAAAKAKKVAIETDFNIVVGDIITTSWNTGPYVVVEVNPIRNKKYNLTLVLPGTKQFKNGTYQESDLFWVSEVSREGDRYPSGKNGEVFVQKKVEEDKTFTEYETIIIADTKNFKFELRLASENGLWYVGYEYKRGSSNAGDYGGIYSPSRNKYRKAYQTRNEAITQEITEFAERYRDSYKELRDSAKEFLKNLPETFSAFEQFKPTLEKLRKEGLRSGSYDWWKSRWYEFVDFKGNDSYSERIRKNDLNKLFPKVWQIYRGELCKIF